MTADVLADPARPTRVVFVACNRNRRRFMEDPSFVYRCQNLAAALNARGHEATLTHISRLNPWAAVDLVVFHRPRLTLALRGALRVLRRRSITLMADVDDLIFDEQLARFSPGVRNGLVPLSDMQRLFASHRRALGSFDRISVSTEPLEEHGRRCFPHARLIRLPNTVHHSWQEMPAASPSSPGAEEFVITYLPGTRSHDRDFATVTPALERLLARHQHLRLHVTGPLSFHVKARSGQVRHFDKLPFGALHLRVQQGRVNLAPLEATPFTRCKSAVKVMEAGFWGIPTVCSPLVDARRFVHAGAIVADGAEAWHDTLERLVCDPGHYAAQTHALRQRVLARADVHEVVHDLLTQSGREAAAA